MIASPGASLASTLSIFPLPLPGTIPPTAALNCCLPIRAIWVAENAAAIPAAMDLIINSPGVFANTDKVALAPSIIAPETSKAFLVLNCFLANFNSSCSLFVSSCLTRASYSSCVIILLSNCCCNFVSS